MTRKITHICSGTCSRQIDIEIDQDTIRSVAFTGGCHGNTQGIAALVCGMQVREVIARLRSKKRKAMYFLWYLLIGLAAGWIANLIVKGNGSGLVVNLIVGLIGGVLGGWLLSLFGLVAVGTLGSLATAVIGAIVLLWIAAIVSHRKPRKEK